MKKTLNEKIDELARSSERAIAGSFTELSAFQDISTPEITIAIINDRKHLRQAIQFALARFKPTGEAAIRLRRALDASDEA